MKKNKIVPGTKEIFGFAVKVNKSPNNFSGKILFPELLRRANEVLNNSANLELITGKTGK